MKGAMRPRNGASTPGRTRASRRTSG